MSKDAVDYMNELTRWPYPPAIDERWIKKLAAACDMIVQRDRTIATLESQLAAARGEGAIPSEAWEDGCEYLGRLWCSKRNVLAVWDADRKLWRCNNTMCHPHQVIPYQKLTPPAWAGKEEPRA